MRFIVSALACSIVVGAGFLIGWLTYDIPGGLIGAVVGLVLGAYVGKKVMRGASPGVS